jgi:hypothetical protein
MGNLTPSQMFDHSLVVVKGPSLLNRLDFFTDLHPSASMNAGGVCSINPSKLMIDGCDNGFMFNRPMPLFAIQNWDDYDVNSDVGNIAGGVLSAVVAVGGFEVETTEYVTGTYRPNDLLTPATGGNLGKVRRCVVGPYKSELVCGCVSTGTNTNEYTKSTLRFWTMFLPAGSHATLSSSSISSASSLSSLGIITSSSSSSSLDITSVSSQSSLDKTSVSSASTQALETSSSSTVNESSRSQVP